MKKRTITAIATAGLITLFTLSCKKAFVSEQQTDATIEKILKVGALGSFAAVDAAVPAKEAMKQMGTGFSLGNVFDQSKNSTLLADIEPIINFYYSKGMRHVRIPVTWIGGGFTDPLADINTGYLNVNNPNSMARLARLDQVIDLALSKPGMFVIINTHHEAWLKSHYGSDTAGYNLKFKRLWTDIANRYKNKSHRLIFEVLNEPEADFGDNNSANGVFEEWQPVAKQRTRQINEVGYRAIRNIPENSDRIIMISPNSQANQSRFAAIYPTKSDLPGAGLDQFLGVSLHTYDKWDFCGQNGNNDVYQTMGRSYLINIVNTVKAHADSLDIAVNFGEFGVGRDPDRGTAVVEQRNSWMVREYYRTLRLAILSKEMSATVWDDRGWFQLIAKNSANEYVSQYNILSTMMEGSLLGKTISLRLKDSAKLYVSVDATPMKCLTRNPPLNSEKYLVVDVGAGSGKIGLKNVLNGKYVSSENGNTTLGVTCNRSNATASTEQFWIEVDDNHNLSLIGNNSKYVSSEYGLSSMSCVKGLLGSSEKFTVATY